MEENREMQKRINLPFKSNFKGQKNAHPFFWSLWLILMFLLPKKSYEAIRGKKRNILDKGNNSQNASWPLGNNNRYKGATSFYRC